MSGGEPSLELRARWWSTVLYAYDVTRELGSRLYAAGTSSAYATRNGVDRALRDLHALGACFESFQFHRRTAALVLMGREVSHPLF